MKTALQKHVLVTEYDSVKQICSPLNELGIVGFIFMRHFPDGSFIDLSNQLEWSAFFLNRYLRQEYNPDMINDHMFISNGVSLWTLNQENIIWQEGEKHFGFGNGISICLEKKAYKDIFCFYSRKENYLMNQFYLNHLDWLKRYCHYFIDKAASLIEKGYQNKLSTPKFYLAKGEPSEDNSTLKLSYSTSLHDLSMRERECIKLSAQGASAKVIANQLSLSRRTIETHLYNAKIKLNCKNISELIHICTKFGFID